MTRLVGVYFATVGTRSVTAAASGLLLVLGWIYAEAQILLAGVELTYVLSRRNDRP